MNAINELVSIGKNNVYSINKIKNWLIDFEEYYLFCQENWNNNSCFGELPCEHTLNSELSKFHSLYNKLVEVSELHKLEGYASSELKVHSSIKDNKDELRDWLIKNREICNEQLEGLIFDYLYYSENEDDNYHLFVNTSMYENLIIYINRNDFENLIEFKELYDDLFYEKKLYPEGYKKFEKKIKNTPFDFTYYDRMYDEYDLNKLINE